MEDITIKIDNKEFKVGVEENGNGKIKVHFDGEVHEVETKRDIQGVVENKIESKYSKKGDEAIITAPLPGVVASVNVENGQRVNRDQVLIKIVAMKMENEILSPKEGTVKDIRVKKNDNVNKGDTLAIVK